MPKADYHFVDRWRVAADCKEVADIIEDALSFPRWWASVYFEVKELEPGESLKLGLWRRRAKSPEERARIPPPPRAALTLRLLGIPNRQMR